MRRATLIVFLLSSCSVTVNAQSTARKQKSIVDYLRQEISAGSVVGAQILVGSTRSRNGKTINLGTVGPGDNRPVSDETVFCLASCSKPLASAAVFTLLDDRLTLDQSASAMIPALGSPVDD